MWFRADDISVDFIIFLQHISRHKYPEFCKLSHYLSYTFIILSIDDPSVVCWVIFLRKPCLGDNDLVCLWYVKFPDTGWQSPPHFTAIHEVGQWLPNFLELGLTINYYNLWWPIQLYRPIQLLLVSRGYTIVVMAQLW